MLYRVCCHACRVDFDIRACVCTKLCCGVVFSSFPCWQLCVLCLLRRNPPFFFFFLSSGAGLGGGWCGKRRVRCDRMRRIVQWSHIFLSSMHIYHGVYSAIHSLEGMHMNMTLSGFLLYGITCRLRQRNRSR
ncbi:unnamed protein product [Ectocarpus sp. 12 AP-2014]